MTTSINAKVFRTALRNLGKDTVSQFPNINRGGCCVFAVNVAKWIACCGIDVQIIIPINERGYYMSNDQRSSNTSVNRIRNRLSSSKLSLHDRDNWDNEGVSFAHVAVRFKLNNRWYTYDSDRLVGSRTRFGQHKQYIARKGSYSITEAEAFANSSWGWNRIFNRNDIPAIKHLIDKHMKALLHDPVVDPVVFVPTSKWYDRLFCRA